MSNSTKMAPSANEHDEQLSAIEKFGYGLGDTASNLVFQSVIMFMPFFYTDIFGISATALGTLMLVVRVFDAITDPVMGAICDRTNTRYGKFRPYLLILGIPFAAITVACFITPSFSYSGKLIYAYITYSLLMAAYTAINIPYCSLGGVITDDSSERVSLNSYRFGLASIAAILVASCTLPLVRYFGKVEIGEELEAAKGQIGFPLAIGCFAAVAAILFIACFLLTKERVQSEDTEQGSFWQDLSVLAKNRPWQIVSLANFLLLIPIILRAGALAYYVKWYCEPGDDWILGEESWLSNKEAIITALHTSAAVVMILGAPFAPWITKFLSHANSYSLIHAMIGIISFGMFFLSPSSLTLLFILYMLTGFFTQMGNPILWAMLADTVDYGERKTSKRITGLSFAGALFALKIGMALGGALLGWVLGGYGYDPNATAQTPSAINGILLTFTILPGIGHLVLACAVRAYKLES